MPPVRRQVAASSAAPVQPAGPPGPDLPQGAKAAELLEADGASREALLASLPGPGRCAGGSCRAPDAPPAGYLPPACTHARAAPARGQRCLPTQQAQRALQSLWAASSAPPLPTLPLLLAAKQHRPSMCHRHAPPRSPSQGLGVPQGRAPVRPGRQLRRGPQPDHLLVRRPRPRPRGN